MAIDHSSHDHPATPAARAACRRTLGAGTPAIRTVPMTDATTGLIRDGAGRLMAVEPRGRARRAPVTADAKPRAIRGIGDMPDVPHVFGEIIHRAWTMGWDVTTATPYNADERRVEITSTAGTAQLVWRANQPHGVTAVWFRPCNTSVASRVDGAPVLAATVRLLGTGHE